MPVVNNVELRWVNHNKPDAYGKLTLDMFLSGDQELDLVDQGLTVKTDDGRAFYRFSYAPTTQEGKEVIIPIYNRYGEAYTGNVPNGVLADVEYYSYQWEFNGKTGTKARVVGVKLLEDVNNSNLSFDKRDNEEGKGV